MGDIFKFLVDNGDKSTALIILAVLIWAARVFWTEYKQLSETHKADLNEMYSTHKRDLEAHNEKYDNVVKQMFEVVDKNTTSNAELSTSIKHLHEKIK